MLSTRLVFLVSFLVATLTPWSSLLAQLRITEMMYESSHPVGFDPDPPQHNYWWEVTNLGPVAIDLDGYSWDDNNPTPGAFQFPSLMVQPGESIIILEKDLLDGVADVDGFRAEWNVNANDNIDCVQVLTSYDFLNSNGTAPTNFPGFGPGGILYLYEPGNNTPIDATPVPAPRVTVGTSIVFPTTGPANSIADQAGAWQANAGDIGSPGRYLAAQPEFVRGDPNVDGAITIGDPIYTLNYLFAGGPAACLSAMDANDDGAIDLGDGIFLLNYLFEGGAAPALPFPDCGIDPTLDALTCSCLPLCP